MMVIKNYIRISPPLVMTHDEVDDMVGRLGVALERAKAGTACRHRLHDVELARGRPGLTGAARVRRRDCQ